MRAAALLLAGLAAASSADEARFDDASRDTLFVLYFPNEPLRGDDSDPESWGDMRYHVEEALPKGTVWRYVEVARDRDGAAAARHNPRGESMFQMRYRGRTVLRSSGVMTHSDIRKALQSKGLLPPDSRIPDGFAATWRRSDALFNYDYEFLDSTFTLARETPDGRWRVLTGAYRMSADTLRFHLKASREGDKPTPEDSRHLCTFAWTRDTLFLHNPCPVAKACDTPRRKSWQTLAGEGQDQTDKLILTRAR